jgi:hypothetical protein
LRRLIALLLCGLVMIGGGMASAQLGVGLLIDSIDSSAFPEIAVTFTLADAAALDGRLPDVSLTENETPVTLTDVQAASASPVTLIFVVDLGRYSSTAILPVATQRNILRRWADGGYFRDGVDAVSIVTTGGASGTAQTRVALEPTQSLAAFVSAVDALDLTAGGAPQSLTTVAETLDNLAALDPPLTGDVAIVLVSRIIDTIGSRQSVPLAGQIGARAATLGIPIHVLHTDPNGQYAEPFQALAVASGGQYLRFDPQNEPDATLNALYSPIVGGAQSYVARYVSTSGSSAERTVTLTANGASASATYQVNVAAPVVTLLAPEDGFALTRTGDISQGDDPVFDTDNAIVRFSVTWTGTPPRALTGTELLVDGVSVMRYDSLIALGGIVATPDGVTETYELTWDLSAYTQEGSNAPSVQVLVTDALGVTTASNSVAGTLTVDIPDVVPQVALVSPQNNATLERVARLDSSGAINGYSMDVVPLEARLTWSGTTPGVVAAAEILVDGAVVQNVAYPTVTVLEPDARAATDAPPQVQATLLLDWDVRGLAEAGANLRDVQVQVRDANGLSAISLPQTLNVQVSVPALQRPDVVLRSPAANTTLTRVALPGLGDALTFQDTGSVPVLASVSWPDAVPRALEVAELIYNGTPLGPVPFPTLLSAEDAGLRDTNLPADLRFFRLTWDVRDLRTPGPNLGQLQVRVRDTEGLEVVSAAAPVNVQVALVAPPTVTILSPLNNASITRSGRYEGSAQPTFLLEQTLVEADVDWSPDLAFVLTGAELIANGQVVATLPPASIDAARQGTSELADGRRRLMVQLPWSLRDIATVGSNLSQLQVRALGEGGVTTISTPVTVNVQVEVPAPMPPLVSIVSPQNDALVDGGSGVLTVTGEVLWSEGQYRPLQLVELSVDGIVRQSLFYPQGTRFELAWDGLANAAPGQHRLSLRVRDAAGVEASAAPVSINLGAPSRVILPTAAPDGSTQASLAPVVTLPPAAVLGICPPTLLAGWENVECLRERVVLYLPWLAVLALLALLWLRTRRLGPGGRVRTVVGTGRSRRPIARLYVVQGPPNLIGESINIYTNVTTLGRDKRVTDIQFYTSDEPSSVSAQHCTLRHVRGRFSLMDDSSSNGTQVNGRYVDEPVLLNDGDEITLGIPDRQGVVVRFHAQVAESKPLPKESAAVVSAPSPQPAPLPATTALNPSVVPTPGLVRGQRPARNKGVDVMDNILSDIGEKADRPFNLDIARPKDPPKDG